MVIWDGLNDTSMCTMGLMLCIWKTKRLLLHPSPKGFNAKAALYERKCPDGRLGHLGSSCHVFSTY